jgi:L-iditol 2-dehydrogenase
MKTLSLNADRLFELKESPLPLVSPGGAILKVHACGICGTDVEKWLDRPDPQHVVLGHELVGTLVSLCPTYRGRLQPGERVVVAHHVPCGHCRYCRNDSESMCEQFKRSNITPGGFSEYIVLTAAHLKKTTFLVPGSVPDARAVHVEPLACVLKAVRRGGTFQQARTLVVGLGYIGLMAAQVYRLRGDDTYSIDTSIERLKASKVFNLHRTAFLPEQLPGGDFDTVFLTVVNPATVAKAMASVRNGGTVVVFADSPHVPSLFDASQLYHREVSVIPSYSPGLQDLKDAARLVFAETIKLTPLITHWAALDDAPALFDIVRQKQAIKAVVYPNGLPAQATPVADLTDQTEPAPDDPEPMFELSAVDDMAASLSSS